MFKNDKYLELETREDIFSLSFVLCLTYDE